MQAGKGLHGEDTEGKEKEMTELEQMELVKKIGTLPKELQEKVADRVEGAAEALRYMRAKE